MERFEVVRTDEMTTDAGVLVLVRGVEVGVFRVDGGYRAYRNLCPHAGAPICSGRMAGGVLRCPWHGWEFDVRTGKHLSNPAIELQRFPVEVEGDRVFVLA